MLKQNGRVITAAGIGQVLVMVTREGWRVLIPLFAANVLQLDIQTIGFVLGFGAAFDLLFFPVSGFLMDRFGRKWAIVPSFVIQGVAVALILFAGNAIVLGGIAAFIGLAWNIFFVQFHELLFPPGTWTFSTSDSLIRLFPELFWFYAGIIMSVFPLIAGIITAVVGYILQRNA